MLRMAFTVLVVACPGAKRAIFPISVSKCKLLD